MKALTDAALVGLARVGTPPAEARDAGERLVSRATELAPERAPERTFLLRLGVQAIRARAGLIPAPAAELPEAAAPEPRPPCSAALAAIVEDLCARQQRAILAEALARLEARGLRLPAQGIPALANLRDRALLPAATQVAGQRGRWLARHNPAWRWLVDEVAPESAQERRRIWDEGTQEACLSALRATRLTDPAEARAWIGAAWKAEKAALREELVAVLASGLSPDDQPVLEQALADRAAGVRVAAARLLARLETSPFAGRARERADAALAYEAPAAGMFGSLRSRLTGKGHGQLSVSPPAAFAPAWADDGLVEKPPGGTGERAFWLRQILALVPPSHWEQRFGATAETLVNAAARTEWAEPALAGWTDATVRFQARGWAGHLWSARVEQPKPEALAELAPILFPLMAEAVVQDTTAAIVARAGAGPVGWNAILGAVPRPWSPALADALLAALLRALADPELTWQEAAAWRASLELAAPALPVAALARFITLSAPAGEAPPRLLRHALDAFGATLAIRQRIDQETRP